MFHLADLLKVVVLGIIEGLTEFIPVSSTAHLVITSHLIDFQAIKNNVFEIAIQLGAILAVILIYRGKIFSIIFNLKSENNFKFVTNILLAFLPSVFIGLLFYKFIKAVLFSNLVISISLIIGGIVMIIIRSENPKVFYIGRLSTMKSILIGLFQCLAMIPGVSRSGATIISGLLLGLSRNAATEFSFFLAIPTIISATAYDLYKNHEQLNMENIQLIILGMIFSFISSIIVIKWLINYVSKHNFTIFGIYRILLGIIILIFTING